MRYFFITSSRSFTNFLSTRAYWLLSGRFLKAGAYEKGHSSVKNFSYTKTSLNIFFSSVAIDSGHFGVVMARERSHGFYPVTIATLDLIKELVTIVSPPETNAGPRINDFIACVIFVCRDIFTGYQKLYYGDLREKQEIGKLIVKWFYNFIQR